ncbi:hypothetical protein Q3H58_002888 [Pseudomonas psychrotolerans]|nr:hypothetical protein [Pseudomonas psychrotolerans]
MQVHARRQLQGTADEVAGRGGGEVQALALDLLAGCYDPGDGAGTRLGDRPHGLFDDVVQAALLVARGGIGAAIGHAPLQVTVVPVHLADQRIGHLGGGGAWGQQVDAVAHLGVLGEHHRGTRAHQQIGGHAQGRVGGDAGEGVAAAALHAHHQLGRWHRFTAALVEHLQPRLDQPHDLLDHAGEAVGRILQAEQPGFFILPGGEVVARHQLAGLQLLAAQTDHQRLAAEVGVAADVVQGADRNHRIGCIDGHAATVAVGQRHHVVDVGIARQDLLAHPLHTEFQHPHHALHGGGHRQDVAGADATVRIAKALEGIALQGFADLAGGGGLGQVVQRWRFRHAQQGLGDPAAGGNVLQGVADDLAIAHYLGALLEIHQGNLVALGNGLDGGQAIGEGAASGHAGFVDHHPDIVLGMELDVARRISVIDQVHGLILRRDQARTGSG